MTDRRPLDALIDEAYRKLDEGDHEAAILLASAIEAHRHTSAFEIGARARSALGDDEGAVAYLRHGLELAGGPWSNWQFLGNLLSDLDRHDEAAEAFEAALARDDAWVASVRLNQAILAWRRGDPEAALAYVAEADDPDLRAEAGSVAVGLLGELGRCAEAAALGRELLDASDGEGGDAWARLAANTLRAEHQAGRALDEVRAEAFATVDRFEPGSADVLELVRELGAQPTTDATRCFRLVLDVRLDVPDPGGAIGYMMPVWVAADDAAEALTLARPLVTDPGTLSVADAEASADAPGPWKGVLRRMGQLWYGPGK